MTYKFPYAVLISKFLEYFNINVASEVADNTATDCEIGATHLGKMGLKENAEGKWVMASELEEIGEDVPAPAPTMAPTSAEPSTSAAPAHASSFELLVMEKLDHILRNQNELSVQIQSVEERVASLGKKLEFIDLNMDDHGAEAVGIPHTHEPQQPSPTEHTIPDPILVPVDEPSSEPAKAVPEVIPQFVSETVPKSEPVLESVSTEVAEPTAKPSPTPVMKCYIRKPKPHIEPTTESAPVIAESSLPGSAPTVSPTQVHMSSPSIDEFTDRESSESPHVSSSSIVLQTEKDKYIFKRIEEPIILPAPDSCALSVSETVPSPTIRINPMVKDSMKKLISEMTFSLKTTHYSDSEINTSIMSVAQDLKEGAEEEKSLEVVIA